MVLDRGLLLALAIVGFLFVLNGLSGTQVCIRLGIEQGVQPQMICKTQSGLGRWFSEILSERP